MLWTALLLQDQRSLVFDTTSFVAYLRCNLYRHLNLLTKVRLNMTSYMDDVGNSVTVPMEAMMNNREATS